MSKPAPSSWGKYFDKLPTDLVVPHLLDPTALIENFTTATATHEDLLLALLREPDVVFLCFLGPGTPLGVVHHLATMGDNTVPSGSRFVALTGWDSLGTPLTIPDAGLLLTPTLHVPSPTSFASPHAAKDHSLLPTAVVDGSCTLLARSFFPIPSAVLPAIHCAPNLNPTTVLTLALDKKPQLC